MSQSLCLDDVRRAWESQDPELAKLLADLAGSPDPEPSTPIRSGALTVQTVLRNLRSREFRRKTRQEQQHQRRQQLQALEAPNAEVPLPERYRLHEILIELWNSPGTFERQTLLSLVALTPIKWGPWRALKRIFKESIERGDSEMFGALTARFDTAFASGQSQGEVTINTLGYLVRRAWRSLRRTAQTLPACYADAAVDVLRFYEDGARWDGTWVANHIFQHQGGNYRRHRFRFKRRPQSLLQNRAYPELWQRTPRPLFTLLERARAEEVRKFASQALRTDFRSLLREVEPAWVARLTGVRSATVDEFVIWILQNVPKFEQGAFRELGLHEAVLGLLDSPSNEARVYAAAYARTHARDLLLEELIRLAGNSHEAVQTLARDLLRDRDPRKAVGLEAWGRLLGMPAATAMAKEMLQKHFGAKELTPDWFKERLLSDRSSVVEFAIEQLPKLHPWKSLGAEYFRALLDDERLSPRTANFATEALSRFETSELGSDFLRRALLHPLTSDALQKWVQQERVKATELGADFWKTLAYEPAWDGASWVRELRESGRSWVRELKWSQPLSELALRLLGDVRKFSPGDLGFNWIFELVKSSNPGYHEFAAEYAIKAFLPADFAPKQEAAPASAPSAEKAKADLGGQSFLFTGKLATMTRAEAESKVAGAGGVNASSVNAKLNFLVIGDEGSPLYGGGRKGDKQLKAEGLQAKGAAIKVISETAFLQMLAGEQRSFSQDSVAAGCDALWRMATDAGAEDEPLRLFALQYLRRHHVGIGPEMTDRPVDPGAEIPASFLDFTRCRALFTDARPSLRKLALDFARWELARWKPPIEAIVELCEAPFPEVRQFINKALLADEAKAHALYRIDPATLTPEAVYSFAESLDPGARELGMRLIAKNPKLAVPQEIFRLTESPDRQVRAFVIRALWSLYRDRGITGHWKPKPPAKTELSEKKAQKKAAAKPEATQPEPQAGPPPKPELAPAAGEAMARLLRAGLFGLPPARPEKSAAESQATPPKGEAPLKKLRPLPARKAKLALIETMRDLAIEDPSFAELCVPLFQEFMDSRGLSERSACLVALVRLGHKPAPASS